MAWFRCKLHPKKDTTVSHKVIVPGGKGYLTVENYIGENLDNTITVNMGDAAGSYPYYKVGKLSIRWQGNVNSWRFYCNENALEYNGNRITQTTNFLSLANSSAGTFTVKEID